MNKVYSLEILWVPFLLGSIGLAYLLYFYRPIIFRLFLAVFSRRLRNEIMRDESEIQRKVNRSVNVFFLFSSGLLLGIYMHVEVLNNTIEWGWLIFSFVPTLFYFARFVLKKFLGYVFLSDAETKEFLLSEFLGNKIFGLIAFPIALILAYNPQFWPFFKWLIISFLVLLIGRTIFLGFQIGFTQTTFPKLYSFLYICTLEILPLLVFWGLLR